MDIFKKNGIVITDAEKREIVSNVVRVSDALLIDSDRVLENLFSAYHLLGRFDFLDTINEYSDEGFTDG